MAKKNNQTEIITKSKIKELLIKAIDKVDLETFILNAETEDFLHKIKDVIVSEEFVLNVIKRVAVIFAIDRKNNYNASDTEFIEWFKNYNFDSEILNEAVTIIRKRAK